jgi:hypothetical protein
MISLEELREIEPGFKGMSDKEMEEIRDLLYAQGQLIFDCWMEDEAIAKKKLNGGDPLIKEEDSNTRKEINRSLPA